MKRITIAFFICGKRRAARWITSAIAQRFYSTKKEDIFTQIQNEARKRNLRETTIHSYCTINDYFLRYTNKPLCAPNDAFLTSKVWMGLPLKRIAFIILDSASFIKSFWKKTGNRNESYGWSGIAPFLQFWLTRKSTHWLKPSATCNTKPSSPSCILQDCASAKTPISIMMISSAPVTSYMSALPKAAVTGKLFWPKGTWSSWYSIGSSMNA